VLEVGPDFRLTRRLDAARMIPGPQGDWILEDVEERRFLPGGDMSLDRAERRGYRFDEDPVAFSVRPAGPPR